MEKKSSFDLAAVIRGGKVYFDGAEYSRYDGSGNFYFVADSDRFDLYHNRRWYSFDLDGISKEVVQTNPLTTVQARSMPPLPDSIDIYLSIWVDELTGNVRSQSSHVEEVLDNPAIFGGVRRADELMRVKLVIPLTETNKATLFVREPDTVAAH